MPLRDTLIDYLIGAGPRPPVGPPRQAVSQPLNMPDELVPHVMQASERFELPPALLQAMIRTESSFNPRATNRNSGAQGLMQLMPLTSKMYGVDDPLNPLSNVMAGSAYMRQLINRFGGLKDALAAYHAGPTAVRRAGGIPYPETQSYVERILSEGPFSVRPDRR